jgi:hypothetical protein
MTVAELIEILNDEPQDATVYATPAYPNSAGLKPEDREQSRIVGWSQTNYAHEGKLGEVYLEVFTDLDGCIE